jgi:hypothetical protein
LAPEAEQALQKTHGAGAEFGTGRPAVKRTS